MLQKIALAVSTVLIILPGTLCAKEPVPNRLDFSKAAVVAQFESSVKGSVGLPEATQTAVIQYLKDAATFSAVLTPEDAKDKEKAGLLEMNAKLVDFAPGNMATRVIIGLGSGRAHAGFEFTIKDALTGDVVWQKTVKETASFWSNSASSTAQRLELPEKIAKTLVKELQKAKGK